MGARSECASEGSSWDSVSAENDGDDGEDARPVDVPENSGLGSERVRHDEGEAYALMMSRAGVSAV